MTGREIFAHRDVASGFRGVAFSPDGRWIATGNASDLVIWDAATGEERFRLPDPGNRDLPLLSLAYSPDGRRIIAGYGQFNDVPGVGHAMLWDAATGKALIDRIPGHRGAVYSVAFSPDGRGGRPGQRGTRGALGPRGHPQAGPCDSAVTAASFMRWPSAPTAGTSPRAASTATLRLWDRATGNEIRAFYGHEGFVRGLAFSPDGRWLLSASEDKSLKLWEVASGRPLADFHGHQSFTSCVAFSPDGRLAASGGQDHAVKLWLATSSPQLTFTGHDGWVSGLAFSPDGRRIVSGAGPDLDPGPAHAVGRDDGRAARDLPSKAAPRSTPSRCTGTAGASPRPAGTGPCGSGISRPASPCGHVRDTRSRPPTWRTARTDGGSPRPAANLTARREPGEVKLWDAETGREIRKFGCTPPVSSGWPSAPTAVGSPRAAPTGS